MRLRLLNVSDGDTFPYSVALLRGQAVGAEVVRVEQEPEAAADGPDQADVAEGGHFKILVRLTEGSNVIRLRVDGCSQSRTSVR